MGPAKNILLILCVTTLGAVAGLYVSPERAVQDAAGTHTASPEASAVSTPADETPPVNKPAPSQAASEPWYLSYDTSPPRPLSRSRSDRANSSANAVPQEPSPPRASAQSGKLQRPTEEELAQLIIKQNESWLFQRNGTGEFITGPNGSRVLSPLGQRYARHVAKAAERGLKSSVEQHDFAITAMLAEVRQGTGTARGQTLVTGRRDLRVYPDLRWVKVAVFAEGFYCERVAGDILRANAIDESPLRSADVILVVVRSPFTIPMLHYSYDSVSELKEDVERELNITGSYGHIHVYGMDAKLGLTQLFHVKADWATLDLLGGR